MSGPRERVDKIARWVVPNGYAGGPEGDKTTAVMVRLDDLYRVLTPDPAASTADAPADTTLRDQIAAWVYERVMSERNRGSRGPNSKWPDCPDEFREGWRTEADALLPLLRAHDAQVAAQARRGGEAFGLREAARRVEVGQPRIAQSLRDLADLRDRAEQDTPDQANT